MEPQTELRWCGMQNYISQNKKIKSNFRKGSKVKKQNEENNKKENEKQLEN